MHLKQDKQLDIPENIRQAIYDRDGMVCRICGKNKNLSIHHILPRGLMRFHDYCNLILLCYFCHRFVEAGMLPHWHANSLKDLFHISPVRAYAHSVDFKKIFCKTHEKLLSIEEIIPARAYIIKGLEDKVVL